MDGIKMGAIKMTPVHVLVVFYSRYGSTEQLALAAGVGAIQAHADIRLRRLKGLADAEPIARDPLWADNLERMNRDYIAPRPTQTGPMRSSWLPAPHRPGKRKNT